MNKINFWDQIHKDTVNQYMKRLGKVYPDGELDREYFSALFIVCADDELRRKCLRYVDFEVGGIDFDTCLEEQDFSSGYGVLVRLASNLFNGNSQVTPIDLIRTLSGEHFQLAIQAIWIRKYNGSL